MSKDIMSLILGLDKLRTFFGNENENIQSVIDSVLKAKPQTSKGTFIKSLSLTATMTPSIKLDLGLTR